jgi:hypothetical protein
MITVMRSNRNSCPRVLSRNNSDCKTGMQHLRQGLRADQPHLRTFGYSLRKSSLAWQKNDRVCSHPARPSNCQKSDPLRANKSKPANSPGLSARKDGIYLNFILAYAISQRSAVHLFMKPYSTCKIPCWATTKLSPLWPPMTAISLKPPVMDS